MPITRLNDEQVRKFITDGFLILDTGLDAGFHETIVDRLQHLETRKTQKGQAGGSMLAHVPELQRVLDAPAIRGALEGILGEGCCRHPQNASVPGRPLPAAERNLRLVGDENGPPVGEGSRGFTYWHKDKLGHTRYHVPRAAFLFYYPQDTPVARGPTRVIPGSHYYDHISESDYPFAYLPEPLKAGSCVLAAIDIEHAGMTNLTDQTRHMAKFSFLRTRRPVAPSWDGGTDDWPSSVEYLGRYEHAQTWSFVWDWMRGRWQSGTGDTNEIDSHVSNLNSRAQRQRLEAIYSLAATGEPALGPLVASLLRVEGQDRIEPAYYQNAEGKYVTRGDPLIRRWSEGTYTVQDEAYALACLGEVAVDSLMELLERRDPWIVLNAAFALGEIGGPAARAVPGLSTLLGSSDHRIVRAALAAIANIGVNTIEALPEISRLLRTDRESWEQQEKLNHLVGDEIHYGAVYALLLSDLDIGDMEDLLTGLLQTATISSRVQGSVLWIAQEILIRKNSRKGRQLAIESRHEDLIGHPGKAHAVR